MNSSPAGIRARTCLPILLVVAMTACEREPSQQQATTAVLESTATPVPAAPVPAAPVPAAPEVIAEQDSVEDTGNNGENRQFNIGNTQYLFNVSDHSPEELEALLQRAEMIRETQADGYDDLEIVLVLHGPDIDFFRTQNYSKHKSIVDLAAKLDAFKIIDMKICEASMSKLGIDRSEVPAFIESVPYAPDEIRRLENEGYLTL